MNHKAYSIRDTKAEIFNPPAFKKTHGEAERDFKSMINNQKETPLSQYPEDYQLYYVGEYNDQTGIFQPLSAPQKVADGVALKN